MLLFSGAKPAHEHGTKGANRDYTAGWARNSRKTPTETRCSVGVPRNRIDWMLPAAVEARFPLAATASAVAGLHRLSFVDRQRAPVDFLARERRHRGLA